MKSFEYINMRTKISNSSSSKFSKYRNLLYSIMIVTARRPNQMYKYYTELSLRNIVILRKEVTLGK
jgi:hydroxymethylpyrimidine pyrophosphatase-like HAD family hydrolase